MATRRKRDSKGRFLKKSSARRRTRRRAKPVRKAAKRRTRRRRSAVAKRAPARKTTRRKRRYRRNPGKMKKPVRTLIAGAQGALGAVIGKAAARAIPQQLRLSTTGPQGIAIQALTALAVGMVADRVAPKAAPFVVAGALMAPIESIVAGAGIPVLSPALSAYPGMPMLPAGRPLAAYPRDRSSGYAGMASPLDAF